jgi:uncharacterized protein GlcG (DUF336 family)
MIGPANLAPPRFGTAQTIPHSLWLLLSITAVALCFFGNGRPGALTTAIAQEKPAAIERPTRPLIRVPTHLSLEEARVIIEGAKSVVQAENGRAAFAVVDFNGNLVSLDSMDGTSSFWVKFAIGKAMGAATLQQSTAESADQLQTNPQRFHSALSLMQGQIILIPGGLPLIIDNVIVGAVGSAGHRGDGDVRAAKAGIAAWEKYRQSKAIEGTQT